MVRKEVESVVGDVQRASDRSKIRGGEWADESDVLAAAADTFTLQQWHLDGWIKRLLSIFPALYSHDDFKICTCKPDILKKAYQQINSIDQHLHVCPQSLIN